MKLGVLIKDGEYRDALVKKISSYDNNIFVNVIGNNVVDASDCLILTDVPPSELDTKVLNVLRPRTVFITISNDGIPEGCNSIFKFSSIHEMLSKLSFVYNQWRGHGCGIELSARLITVCCETDAYASERCRALAGQIIYSHGGRVILLPLSYINDYGTHDFKRSNSLSRLLYSIQSGREMRLESIIYTDSYGISSLLLEPGSNPVACLDDEELRNLIFGLSKRFDTIIADVGTCFRNENLSLMKDADNIVYFERGRRITGIEDMLGSEAADRVIRVKITGGAEDAVAMDECLKQIYGADIDENFKGANSKEIRS